MTNPHSQAQTGDKTQEVLTEVIAEFGRVPNFFQAQAMVDPAWLEINWQRTKQILLSEGALDRKTKELIAMTVSMVNHCDYCALSHEAMAMKAGATEREIHEVKKIMELLVSFNAIANSLRIRCDIVPVSKPEKARTGSRVFIDDEDD